MAMKPLADVATELGSDFDADRIRSIAQKNDIHIEVVKGVETVDPEAIRAILTIQAVKPRLDHLETVAKGLTVIVRPAAHSWKIPVLSAAFAALAAGSAWWAADTASKALKATSGFAALEQLIDALEATTDIKDKKKVLEIRLWLAKKMKDEGVISDTMWGGLLDELCPEGKNSDPEFLRTECDTHRSSQTTTGQSQSGTVTKVEDGL